MHGRFIFYLVICIGILGCSQWETKKISTEDFFDEAWEAIAISEVDTYPFFEQCSELEENVRQRECFVSGVRVNLQEHLSQYPITLKESLTDTLHIYCEVSDKGAFCIDSIQVSSRLQNVLPEIELWIYDGIKTIPKVIPATKRGIPVNMKFELPVVFQED